MQLPQATLSVFKNRIRPITAYFSTLYYLEIIYIMFILLIVYGKKTSVIVGLTLSIMLTTQIIALYLKNKTSRKIQLFLMDFHFAYSISFFINASVYWHEANILNISVIIIRAVIFLIEMPIIYFLTDKTVIKYFQQQPGQTQNT